MANETVSETINGAIHMLEPYLGAAIVEQIQNIDALGVSLGILAVSVVAATIALLALKIIGRRVVQKTETEFDDRLLKATEKPLFKLIIIAGFYLAVLNLGVETAMFEVILKAVATIGYLTIILFAVDLLNVVVNHGIRDLSRKTNNTLNDEIVPIFHKAAVVVVWAFGLILVLGAWGVEIAPFLAGLGIAGLAVSFALQTTLSNVIAGVALIMDKTFKVGDKVQLESGELGTIHEISLRSTRLKTYDNEIIIIPNDNLAKSRIRNYTQPDAAVRVVVKFSAEYGSDPEKVIRIIEDSIKKGIKDISAEPPVSVIFSSMGDHSLNFLARFWVKDYKDAYAKSIEANTLIYNTLRKNRIGIPFPTRTVYMKK